MKHLALLIIAIITLSFSNSTSIKTKPTHTSVATCRGSASCSACSNCNYCKHCNAGGSCGVCSNSSRQRLKTNRNGSWSGSSVTGTQQCKGITKKGSRCKRMVRGGGYCWQHA